MLKEIKVPLTNALKESDGSSADINKGFKGKYVYLVPVYTTNHSEAASSIQISNHNNSIAGRQDLAVGTGGKYRYVSCVYGGAEKIGDDVQLWRTEKSNSLPSRDGYRFSGDINAYEVEITCMSVGK